MFTNADFQGLDLNQDDPMVITLEAENIIIKKIVVDQGSLINILY